MRHKTESGVVMGTGTTAVTTVAGCALYGPIFFE